MAKNKTRVSRRKWIAFVLVGVVLACLVLTSAQEKYGVDFGLAGFKIPGSDLIHALFDDYAGGYPAAAIEQNIENPGVAVHFIDVGQAKAILVQAPEKNVLIDAGENDQGQNVIRYLAAHGVRKIDIAIGTHPHSDHIGGLDTVIDGMTVNMVVMPYIPEEYTATSVTYTDLLRSIANAGLKITTAKPGEEYDLGGGAALTILGPVKNYEDLNDVSVISKLKYGDISFLFTGDATTRAEGDMLGAGENLRANVLDVGHHGSQTSTSEMFLLAVRPAVSVISCGIDNQHKHPHRDVMSRLKEYGQKIYRTDINGTVVVSTDGESVGVQTEKGGES